MIIPKNHESNFTNLWVKRFPQRGQNRAFDATWLPQVQIMSGLSPALFEMQIGKFPDRLAGELGAQPVEKSPRAELKSMI
jgi:hypothetical protein